MVAQPKLKRRRVYIVDAAAPTRVVHWGESVTDNDLLPGFALLLNLLFTEP